MKSRNWNWVFVCLLGVLGTFAAASSAHAQATAGAISGIVRDTSGGVLPGVTVEASSPALIEKVRSAISDDQGRYSITDLRPGVYTVTFTLPGFSVVKREGLELTTGFTAQVNADLAVGSLEETVTVTGASPVVDIQNVRQQTVLSRELLDNLPTNKSIQGYAALTLGASTGATSVGDQADSGGAFGVHGSRGTDSKMTTDGMQTVVGVAGNGASRYNSGNQGAIQETTIQTGGITAEAMSGGVQINIVPKDGGNVMSGYFSTSGASPSMAGENLSDELVARGLTAVPSVRKIYDVGGSVGGPIMKDKMWFLGAARSWGASMYLPGLYYNKNQGNYVGGANTYFGLANSGVTLYEPDLDRPAYNVTPNRDITLRLTWQVNAKNKIALTNGRSSALSGGAAANTTPEAAPYNWHKPIYLHQVTWSYPMTNRVLFEAGATRGFERSPTQRCPDDCSPFDIGIQELSTGLLYNASAKTQTNYACSCKNFIQANSRFAMSYVTGSHAFKTGYYLQQNWNHDSNTYNFPPVKYSFRNGVPQSIQEFAELEGNVQLKADLGIYAQDQWTMNKLTLNLGVRFNYFNGHVPAAHVDEKTFVFPQDTPEVSGVPAWKDFDPRVGAAYDLFGNGKTAIKTSVGRYVALEGVNGVPRQNVPGRRVVTDTTRTWSDANTNYVPDCDLRNPEANGECGRAANVNIGKPVAVTTYAEDVLRGWSVRGYNWQGQVSVQHELKPGMALNVGYFRTWFGNFAVQHNQALTAADFDSYCVTAPTDSRLGSTSGQQICGFYDVKPAKFGIQDNLITQASNYGKQSETFDGMDIGINARFGKGGSLQGGMSMGRTVTDNCATMRDHPENFFGVAAVGGGTTLAPTTGPAGSRSVDDFCHLVNSQQTQYKFAGNYPLPWGLQTSVVYQNLPGIVDLANQNVSSSAIAPSLGRNLSAGANANVQTSIMVPSSKFEDRISQIDLRLAKNINVGKAKLRGQIDLYNLMNASTITTVNTTYGATWLQPQTILGPRLIRVGATLDF